MAKNLQDIEFEQKESIRAWVHSYIQDNTDGYKLSMGLLVAAYLGDLTEFRQAETKIQVAIVSGNLPAWGRVEGSFDRFNAWMYGRMLVATKVIDCEIPLEGTKALLDQELNTFKQKPAGNELGNAFVAWGWSYYALGLEDGASIAANQEAVKAAPQLTGSNQIWAWVMIAQAAGQAKDQAGYDAAIKGLGLDQANGVQALFDRFPADDYRAWGFAALRIAARDMGDTDMFKALAEPTQQAIAAATIDPDKMLAIVYNEQASVPARRNSMSRK